MFLTMMLTLTLVTVVHSRGFLFLSESLDSEVVALLSSLTLEVATAYRNVNRVARPISLTNILVWGRNNLLLTVHNRSQGSRRGDVTISAPSRIGCKTGTPLGLIVRE
jgi:hypothetical protein